MGDCSDSRRGQGGEVAVMLTSIGTSIAIAMSVQGMRQGRIRDRGRSWGSSSGQSENRRIVLGVGRIVPGEA